MPSRHRVLAAFVLTSVMDGYRPGQEACLHHLLHDACWKLLDNVAEVCAHAHRRVSERISRCMAFADVRLPCLHEVSVLSLHSNSRTPQWSNRPTFTSLSPVCVMASGALLPLRNSIRTRMGSRMAIFLTEMASPPSVHVLFCIPFSAGGNQPDRTPKPQRAGRCYPWTRLGTRK